MVRKKDHEINGAMYTFYEDGRVLGKNGKEIVYCKIKM